MAATILSTVWVGRSGIRSWGKLLKDQQARVRQTYGYRRMWLGLEGQGIHYNPKTVLRVMKKYEILAEIRRARKWVNMGQQLHKYENLLNRNFRAKQPNTKWVTDISYIHTCQGTLYPLHDPRSL